MKSKSRTFDKGESLWELVLWVTKHTDSKTLEVDHGADLHLEVTEVLNQKYTITVTPKPDNSE